MPVVTVNGPVVNVAYVAPLGVKMPTTVPFTATSNVSVLAWWFSRCAAERLMVYVPAVRLIVWLTWPVD